MTATRPPLPSFTCPACGNTSHHPDDVANGYCGRCHQFTGRPQSQPQGWAPPPVQVNVAVPQGPQGYITQGQMGYGQLLFHWTMIVCTCGLWWFVYRSKKRKLRSVTRAV